MEERSKCHIRFFEGFSKANSSLGQSHWPQMKNRGATQQRHLQPERLRLLDCKMIKVCFHDNLEIPSRCVKLFLHNLWSDLENGAHAEKTSIGSGNLPIGAEASNTRHNTTLGTIAEESKFDPADYVIKYYASRSDMFWFVWTLLIYFADIFTDVFLALAYLSAGQVVYFSLTIGLVALASLTMTIFSLVLYIEDYRILGDRASPLRWFIRSLCLLCQLAPFLRLVPVVT